MRNDPLSGFGPGSFDAPRLSLSTAIHAERAGGKILLLERAEGSAMAGVSVLVGADARRFVEYRSVR